MQQQQVKDQDRYPITVTAILRKEKDNKSDRFPIWIRGAMNGNKVYRSIKYSTTKNLWNSKMNRVKPDHPQAASINAEIGLLISEINQRHSMYVVTGKGDLKSIVKGEDKAASAGLDSENSDPNIFIFMDSKIKYFEGTKGKKPATIKVWRTVLNRLNTYLGNKEMTFSELNLRFIQDWTLAMFDAGYHNNTVLNTMEQVHGFTTLFRTDYNIKIEVYDPFKGYDWPERSRFDRDRLSIEEMDRFMEYAEKGEEEDTFVKHGGRFKDGSFAMKLGVKGKTQAAIYFLLGCYTGLRHSDWKRFDLKKHVSGSGIKGLYALKNGKHITLPRMHGRFNRLVELMKKHPYTITYKEASAHLKTLAEEFEIDKMLTTHCGRKTFAVTVCAENKISCEVCATMMGISIFTCMKSYYQVTEEKVVKEVEEGWANL